MKQTIIVGFGFMGQTHRKVYDQLPGVKVAAIVDASAARAKKAMRREKVDAPLFPDLATALKNVEADIVSICLPTDCHADAALQAIAAGKHVFCEKPIALSLAEARRMAVAAKEAKIIAQVGHCVRFWPEYIALMDFAASGKAGPLRSLSMQRRGGRPGSAAGQWLLDPSRSGGAAVDFHIHDTDFALFLLGKPDSVRSVATWDAHGPSHIFTTYHYKDGPQVIAEGGWNYPRKWGFQMAFQAVFENGAMEYDINTAPTLVATIGGGAKKPFHFKVPATKSSGANTGGGSVLPAYFNELRYFMDRVERNEPPEIATFDQSAETLRVVLAEVESAKSGRAIRL